MTTVSEAIEHFNKRNETAYDKIEVQITKDGKAVYENFYDVYDISYNGDMICFYGKSTRGGTERYTRIDNSYVIRSEVQL